MGGGVRGGWGEKGCCHGSSIKRQRCHHEQEPFGIRSCKDWRAGKLRMGTSRKETLLREPPNLAIVFVWGGGSNSDPRKLAWL